MARSVSKREQGRNASSVGMMEGAFFVSRTELLDWVNGLLGISLTKVEQCASGAVYCQIVDACHPGSVKMSKVNWMARADHEFIPNYKILQAAFDRNCVQKHIPVDQLIRAKYQDNLEFLQWMKAMGDREGAGVHDYDPEAARQGLRVPAWAQSAATGSVRKAAPRAEAAMAKENLSSNRDRIGADKFDPSARRGAPAAAAGKAAVQRGSPQRTTARAPGARPTASDIEDLKLTIDDQDREIDSLQQSLNGMENERDYYFGKLRKLELLFNNIKEKTSPDMTVQDLVSQVESIIYAADDEDEEEPQEGDAGDLNAEEGETSPLDLAPEMHQEGVTVQ